MLSYIVRRILLILPTLIGITALVFFVMSLAPGGVMASLMSQEGEMRAAERAARQQYLNERFGLNDPKPVQYLRWLNHVSPLGWVRGADGRWHGPGFKAPDLGRSFTKQRPVADLIAESLPVTLLLNLLALPITYVIGVLAGIVAARYRGRWFDTGTSVTFLALWSIPTIWAGVMIQGFLANRQYCCYFPVGGLHDFTAEQMAFMPHFAGGGWERGWLLDTLWHLALPVVCMSYVGLAFLSKLTRSSILENMSADFVRTARAKGVPERHILFRHVFRNSLLPLITVAADILPGLLVGAVIVETIFSLNGMGLLMVQAAQQRDQELVLSETLVVSLIGLVSYLIADIGYAIADPRVTYV
jgi:peptide/nickel transport system permease protein